MRKLKNRNWCFTADPHYNHGNIIKFCDRPFLCESDREYLDYIGGYWENDTNNHRISEDSIELMNESLIYETNKICKKDDVLVVIGDFGMYHGKDLGYYKKCREVRDRIDCDRIILVNGNHDNSIIYDLFEDVVDLLEVCINHNNFVFSHYAMVVWNKSHHNSLHLYGHSHSGLEKWCDKFMPGRRSMDAGVDNIYKLYGKYRPITSSEVIKRLGNRPGFNDFQNC